MDTETKKIRPFINFSNHPAEKWDPVQTAAALEYGSQIIDLPFPSVDPNASAESLSSLAGEITETILDYKPGAVMCQGEFGLCYSVIKRLRAKDVTVLHACSERKVHMEGNIKTLQYDFVQFREYE